MAQPNRNLFLLVVLAVLAVAGGLAALRFLEETSTGAARRQGPVPVRTAKVVEGEFFDRIEALGTARANESVTITAQVTETVRRTTFEDGQVVEAGDILVELTDTQEAAELEEARASLLEAEQQFERAQDGVNRGFGTRAGLDTAIANRNSARARVRAIEARLADRLVRAPFDGQLGLRSVSPGTLVEPGTVITTLDDINPIKLDFSVPETFFTAVRQGLTIQAKSDAYDGEAFEGQITAVDTRIDPETRAVIVRALIPNDDLRLRPGMLLRVEIIKNRRRSLMVPETAIVPLDTRVFVFKLVDGERVERVQIETGTRRVGTVEVLSGLEPGDEIVVAGTSRVRAGGAVVVQTSDANETGEANSAGAVAGASSPAAASR